MGGGNDEFRVKTTKKGSRIIIWSPASDKGIDENCITHQLLAAPSQRPCRPIKESRLRVNNFGIFGCGHIIIPL